MPPPITERVKKLREEIAELTGKNRAYSCGPKYGSAVADNERRFQRLIETLRGRGCSIDAQDLTSLGRFALAAFACCLGLKGKLRLDAL
jgi:hypothetical protein